MILPYKDEIIHLIKLDRSSHHKQRLNAKRVYELLKEKYPDYPCSYYTTRKFYQKFRLEFYSLSKQYVPLIHNPGNAQVDFGTVYYIQNEMRLKAYILTVSFPYSNAFYCQVFRGKSSECMLQGLKNIFNHIGGVPYEIAFDNDTSIVQIGEDNCTRLLNDLFLRFKNHYNFKTHFCNLHSPQEKANVEKAIHTLRMQVFSPTPIIDDFDEFNKYLLHICESKQDRNRKGFYKTPVKNMFETDKQNFLPLPEIDFEVCTIKNRRCNDMGCVVIQDKHYYYLSPEYIRKKVIVKFNADTICFFDEFYQLILQCKRLYENTNAIYVNWRKYFKLFTVKTGALTNCNILESFPEIIKDYILDADIKERRILMSLMHTASVSLSYEDVISAVKQHILNK